MLEKDIVKSILKYLKTVPNCFSSRGKNTAVCTAQQAFPILSAVTAEDLSLSR